MTRATLALLRGDLSAAYALHPLAAIVAPLFAVAVLWGGWRYVTRGSVSLSRPHLWAGAALLVALAAVWVARFFGAFGGPVAV
jgi:hypothetical protein